MGDSTDCLHLPRDWYLANNLSALNKKIKLQYLMSLVLVSVLSLVLVFPVFISRSLAQEVELPQLKNPPFDVCLNRSNGRVAIPATDQAGGKICPAGMEMYDAGGPGVCVTKGTSSTTNVTTYEVEYAYADSTDASNGKPYVDSIGRKCLNPNGAAFGDYIAKDSIPKYNPTTTTPPIIPPTTGGTTPPKTGGATPPKTGSTPPKNHPKTQTSTDCGPGFEKIIICVPVSPFGQKDTLAGQSTFAGIATKIINLALYLAGIIAVLFIIFGGYLVMTARGNESQSTTGRKTLIDALIGLGIVVLSYAIVQAVTAFLTT